MPFIIPNQTSTSLLRPTNIETPWVRPDDWITITDTPGEVQFLWCNAISPYTAINTIFTQTGGVGNIYIDWGDGTTDTISTTASTTRNHTYTSGGTPCSRGYSTWKIRIYGDVGTTISFARPTINVPIYAQLANPQGILEMVFGDGTMTDGEGFRNYTSGISYYMCEYIKCPSVMNNVGAVLSNAFANIFALRKIVLPVSTPNLTSCATMLSNCYKLTEPVVFPQDATGITSINSAFANCASVRSITLPPTLNSLTDSISAFNSCFSLTSIDVPPMPNNLLMNSMFLSCYALISLELKSFPTAAGTCFMDSFCNGCASLEYIKLPSVLPPGVSLTLGSAFASCGSLKNIVLPDIMPSTANGLLGTFSACYSLSSIVLPSSASGITNLGNTFNNCQNLQSITLPSVIGATMGMNNTFNACRSLSEITIPSGWTISDLGATFNGCGMLEKAILPNNAQNSFGNMANTFNGCSVLTTLVLPTSMNGLTSLNTTFQNCISLEEITLPSSLPALTQINSMCNACRNLTKITLPTSAAALTIVQNAFQNCFSLRQITLPTTTGNIGSFLSFANAAYSITNLNLPSTQSTNLTSINGLFSQTWNLTGATNVDKLGNPSTAATIYIDGGNNTQTNIPSLDFYCKFSVLNLSGQSTAPTRLAALRLRNSGAGQYAGTSPQINISYTSMGQAALVQIFNDLPTLSSKTINITGCPGASLLTPAERAIATGKGWTIVG